MLIPEAYPVNPEDLIFMVLAPLQVPLFTLGVPDFANESLIRSHRINAIEVTPVVYERRTPEWYDGARSELPVHEVLMFFDPDEYPVEDYGLIFGDKAFEAHCANLVGRVFPPRRYGTPEYTSLNEQGDDYVSMRFPIGDGRGFSQSIRNDVALFEKLSKSRHVQEMRLIDPITAERYRQSIEPRRPDGARPTPPKGLYTGMWITWTPPSK